MSNTDKQKVQMGIGYSPLTDTVYLGKQNPSKGMWVGEKRDIKNEFLAVSFAFFEVNTIRNISQGKERHIFIHIKEDKEGIEKAINNLQKLLNKLA